MAKTTPTVTVFYAWQDDRPADISRNFIKIALEEAAKRISDDPTVGVEIKIDSDTQGVVGQVHVSNTILEKIEACDIFAGDFTFVSKTRKGKCLPNPNVMIEWGYARKTKGEVGQLNVINTAFGPSKKLPFDMTHLRHPVEYETVAGISDGERRKIRDALSKKLEAIIRATIPKLPVHTPQRPSFIEQPSISPGAYFKQTEVLAKYGESFEEETYRFQARTFAYLRLIPVYGDYPTPGKAKVDKVFQAERVVPLTVNHGPIVSRNQYGSIVADVSPKIVLKAATQGFETGELWGINQDLFRVIQVTRAIVDCFNSNPGPIVTAFDMITLEKTFVRALRNYVRVAKDAIGLSFPFSVEAGITGTKDVRLVYPVAQPNMRFSDPLPDVGVSRRTQLDSGDDAAIKLALKPIFDAIYDAAFLDRSTVLTDKHVDAHELPPL